MDNTIPTAEEFFRKFKHTHSPVNHHLALIEFARLHVEAALKAALEDIPCLGSSTDIASYEEVKEAVLNAYPLTLIK